MKSTLLTLMILTSTLILNGQGAGFGYQIDFGHKNNFDVGEGYSQSMQTTGHSFFVRWHTKQGRRAHQFVNGLRIDSIGFVNKEEYLLDDMKTFQSYNSDAYLKRIAWRFGYMTHRQFAGEPGKFVLSFNYGLFYEFTSQMKRQSINDNMEYKLYSEQNRHNLVGAIGFEARFWYFTLGYKYEQFFFDMINHDYVKNIPMNPSNSSELRSVKLKPSMSLFYIVFNFDFYNSGTDFEFN